MTGNDYDREAVKKALVDIIDDAKGDGQTTLDAALNVIMNHADTIRVQHDEIEELKGFLRKFTDDLQELLEESS